jgi:hypothetical protein
MLMLGCETLTWKQQCSMCCVYTNGLSICFRLLLLQVTVPAGQQILSFMYGYQRDPAYWPAALEFKPERWLPVRPKPASNATDAY